MLFRKSHNMIIVFFYESLEKKTNSNNINLRKNRVGGKH